MKIKKALLKDSFKEIKTSYKRFISIMLMALLGVGFFAGLRASSPDMVDSIDKYYKDQNVYDIEVISTLGLTNEDIEALKQVENVDEVYGTYSQDGLIKDGQKETVAKILTLDDVNKPVLVEGKMPENSNECLVERDFLESNAKNIGDTIEIESKIELGLSGENDENSENQKQEGTENGSSEEENYLKNQTLKIVGVVQSPLYISRERGTSKLGSGQINSYIYVTKENINTDIYTEIYIKLENSEKYKTASKSYEEYVEETKNNIENIKEERENARYQELIDEANKKILDAQEEFDKQKQEGEAKIADAEKQIQDGKNQIAEAEAKIQQNENETKTKFASSQSQLNSAKETLNKSEEEYNSNKTALETVFKEAENQKEVIQTNLNTINTNLEQINKSYQSIEESLKNPDITDKEKEELESTKIELEAKKVELEETKATLENNISELETKVSEGKAKLEKAKTQIEEGKVTIQKQEKTLQTAKTQANTEIANAKKELEKSKEEINTAEAELEANRQEFNQKIRRSRRKAN